MTLNGNETLRRDLKSRVNGEIRFDRVSRVLYSTDASVYQIEPLGGVVVRSRETAVHPALLLRSLVD
jgi:hypothetical protein